MTNPFDDLETVVIHRYTRRDALRDGVLVDVTGWASSHEIKGGFRIPVAMSAAVWALIRPTDSLEDVRARAQIILRKVVSAIHRNIHATDRLPFTVRVGPSDVRMWLHVGPGDDAEPGATIMLEGED